MTMMQTYYECPPQANLAVPLGASKTFAIPYPTRRRLTKLNILQVSGTPVAFTADLFNHAVPDSPSSGNADEMWRVAPTIADNTAGVLTHNFPDVDVFYINQDANAFLQVRGQDTPTLVSVNARNVIYVRITNGGGNAAIFNLILGSEVEQ
jgi:hypothetical protein